MFSVQITLRCDNVLSVYHSYYCVFVVKVVVVSVTPSHKISQNQLNMLALLLYVRLLVARNTVLLNTLSNFHVELTPVRNNA